MISIRDTGNKIRGIAFSIMMLLLLSAIVSSQNTFINTVYADHNDDNDNKKVMNKSLISDISDQVVNTPSNKEGVQNILQLIQIQIAQTSGQDKATKTINLINSIINLNPNGPLAQSLLYLSKQQAIGNANSVIEAAVEVAVHVANGGEDIEEIIKEAASHTHQVLSSQSPSMLSPSPSLLQSSPSQSLPNNVVQLPQPQQQQLPQPQQQQLPQPQQQQLPQPQQQQLPQPQQHPPSQQQPVSPQTITSSSEEQSHSSPAVARTDRFGIRELYQSKPGGEEWFMNMDIANDSRSGSPSLTKNADGSFTVSGQENVRYRIYTSTGYHEPSNTNQQQLAKQGYMLAPNDWKNVEMTGYVRVAQNEPSDNHFTWYARGGIPTSTRGCEGTSIKGQIFVDGHTNFAKEQWHTGGYVFTPTTPTIAGSIVGKWIGFKMVTYNFQENGKTVVMMQNWVDKDNNGNWVKIYEYIDRGGLGTQGNHCGAANPDQIITWGGPIAMFGWDHFNAVDIKNFSIREIQPPQ
jgi:hypothetical protein